MNVSAARRSDRQFEIGNGTVHAWHADLATLDTAAEEHLKVLDETERERASRLIRAQDRAQFIAAHAVARLLLGEYLGRPAQSIRYDHQSGRKPFVIRSSGEPDLRFNASRTKDRAAFAFAIGRDVGIDVERIVNYPGLADVYGRALSVGECETIAALPSEEHRQKAFFALWVRKEAVLKACGRGLAAAPAQLDVSRAIIRAEARTWRIEEFACERTCAAAVAAEGNDWRMETVRCFNDWQLR